jgi:hypothetical protein
MEENKYLGVPDKEDVPKEHSIDQLALGLADGTLTRGRALKALGAALLLSGPLTALWPATASARRKRQHGHRHGPRLGCKGRPHRTDCHRIVDPPFGPTTCPSGQTIYSTTAGGCCPSGFPVCCPASVGGNCCPGSTVCCPPGTGPRGTGSLSECCPSTLPVCCPADSREECCPPGTRCTSTGCVV